MSLIEGFNPQQKQALKHLLQTDFRQFVKFAFKIRSGGNFVFQPHHDLIIDVLQKVIKGDIMRLIMVIPPRHSKSELVSVMLSAFAYVQNRRSDIIQTTYSDSLCREMSTGVRDILFSEEFVDLFGFGLRKDMSALNDWGMTDGGKAHFIPTGGSLTGKGAGTLADGFTGLMVIDDPLKPEDAYSQARRSSVNNRYTNTLLSRLAKRKETPIVIIQQRLHDDDMIGYLLNGGSGEQFHYLMMPAILNHDTGSEEWYKKQRYTHAIPITYDFGVAEGSEQALWPTRVDLDELREMEEGDVYTFSSQYMGDPVPAGGSVFKREWFNLYDEVPHKDIQYIRIYADTAMKTGQHHDFSVLQAWAYTKNGDMYLLDMLRGKWEAPELLRTFLNFYKKWKVNNKLFRYSLQCAVVENKASGTGLIQQANRVPGVLVREVQADKDKVTKAMSAAPVCQSGRVYIPADASWLDQFLIEVCSFSPTMAHKHDDITDVLISACFDLVINNNNLWTEAML
jgi:predicted phage terminase large subunit-like protein